MNEKLDIPDNPNEPERYEIRFRDISATGGLTGSRDFVSIKSQTEHPF
ncbi:hypothetical protein [Paenibacillus cellulositrophicus]